MQADSNYFTEVTAWDASFDEKKSELSFYSSNTAEEIGNLEQTVPIDADMLV